MTGCSLSQMHLFTHRSLDPKECPSDHGQILVVSNLQPLINGVCTYDSAISRSDHNTPAAAEPGHRGQGQASEANGMLQLKVAISAEVTSCLHCQYLIDLELLIVIDFGADCWSRTVVLGCLLSTEAAGMTPSSVECFLFQSDHHNLTVT